MGRHTCRLGVLLCALMARLAADASSESPFGSEASKWVIKTWQTEDGLPENSATAMAQTPDGCLWFGTFNGLVRFNGVEFEVFNPATTPQLPSANIINLHCDRAGRLWVSTLRGLAVRENWRWRTLGTNEGWAGNYVRTFSERTNGELLMTTFDGHVLEFAHGGLVELPAPGEPGQGYIGCVDEAGHWWVAQHQFIGLWDGQRWVSMVVPATVHSDQVMCTTARDGGVWLLIEKELRKYRKSVEVSRVQCPKLEGGIWSMSEDGHGTLWICTYNQGVFQILADGQVQRWTTTNGLSSASCRFVFEDREGNHWVGTSGGGLARFTRRRFQSIGLESGLTERVVNSLWPAQDGGLWIATQGKGLFRLQDGKVNSVPLPVPNTTIYAQSVLSDHRGRLWVATSRDLWLSGAENFSPTTIGQPDGEIRALFEDSRGRVWIGGGLGVSMREGESLRVFTASDGLPPDPARCFAEDNRGVIWLSTRNGLFRRETDRFVEVKENGQSLSNIICLKTDADGTLWMGTLDDGLLCRRDGRLKRIGIEAGLPVRAIHGILEDNAGFFWLASNRGVVRVPVEGLRLAADGKISRLDSLLMDLSDGLPSVECSSASQPSCARDGNGRLWFATAKGVATINPAELRLNEITPPTAIEEISFYRRSRVNAKSQHGAASEVETRLSAPFSEPMLLPAGSHRIAIRYAAFSFTAPEKVRFQVKLEGEDRSWVDANAQRVAYYHDLLPREYQFRVRAANNDNAWNETGTSLAFSVLPFYWQTAWFRFLVTIGVATAGAGAAWAVIRGKVRNLAERERAQAALEQSEARYRGVVESQTELVCRYLADTTLTFVNEAYCRYFGKGREELIGAKFLELIPSAAWKTVLADIATLNKEHRTQTHEHQVILPDGTIGWQQWVNHLIDEEDKGVPEYQAIGRDISDRKHAEEAKRVLAHAARVSTVGTLAGSIAHELNQPLTAILSNAQAGSRFLAEPSPNIAEVQDVLQDIAQDTKRAGEVIQQLRRLIKKEDLRFDELQLNQVIQDTVRLLHSDAVIRRVQTVVNFHHPLRPVRGDRVQLQQVMLNLMLNAFDAMKDVPNGGRVIRIRTLEADAGVVQVEVTDRGTGILPEQLATLFEPFQTTKQEGLGLGLTISRSIVEAHGGRLWATNNPDRGSTFCFTLPLFSAPASSE